jgi:ornithine cyclodeaminase/alanine dehydrogenase-like protein (mu-crystallin family)
MGNAGQQGAQPPGALSSSQLWEVSDRVNLEAVFIDELMAAGGDDPGRGRPGTCRLEPWRDPLAGSQPDDHLLFEDDASGTRRIMPGSSLRSMRVASLAVLAARRLAAPGVLTVAVLSHEAPPLLEADVIARYVANVSHIAIWPGLSEARTRIDAARLAQRLDRAGTALSMTGQLAEAVRGANLVLVVEAGKAADSLSVDIGHFVRGAVIVNATGRELPCSLTAGIEHIVVDYPGLLSSNPRRYLAEPDEGAGNKPQIAHRVGQKRPRPIMADLLQIMTGTHVSRPSIDDMILVELLSANSLSVELAYYLNQAIVA